MSPGRRVRFGPFEADVATGELRKHGVPVRLQEQPSKILATLLERPGEVVAREDLIKLLWADGTFVDYDRGLNAAVNRLRQALSDSAEAPRYVETVPRRGYRFIAAVEDSGPESPPQTPVPAPQAASRRWPLFLAIGVAAVGVGIWAWLSRSGTSTPPGEPVPITALDGIETEPSLSPDGSQVVFSWNGENHDNFDIYVKVIGSTDPPLRLTNDPAADRGPVWSPDGRYVVFNRDGHGLYLVSPIGGRERMLVARPVSSSTPSWSADSRAVAFILTRSDNREAGVFAIGVDGGEARRITTAPPSGEIRAAVLSPDSRALAVSICQPMSCALSVTPLDERLTPRSDAWSVAIVAGSLYHLAWTRDGGGLVFSEFDSLNLGAGQRLRRVAIDGRSPPETIPFGAKGAAYAAIASTGARMVYSHVYSDIDIWKIEGGASSRSPISSTLRDDSPQFSPDGNRVAFGSNRSGRQEVWIANADGSGAVPLTTSRASGTPRWSPDGKLIVYDTLTGETDWDIAVVDANGGAPRMLVTGPSHDYAPSFSRDGKWVYFASNRDQQGPGIYRVPVSGGKQARVSRRNGVAFESIDAKSIYVATAVNCRPLFVQPLDGGLERQFAGSPCHRAFAVTDRGVYYIGDPANQEAATARQISVRLLDPATGTSKEVGRSEEQLYQGQGLTVSPDGKTILFSGSRQAGADLYLVDGFR